VFLVSQCALGAATAVSLVCMRANGAAAAGAVQFKCKLWVELPSNKDKLVLIKSAVRSSDLSNGFPAADTNMFLAVPPVLLHDASGEAPDLMVCIDKACVLGGATGQE
jgi:E3 ubiquitin-protein ligase SIAH1